MISLILQIKVTQDYLKWGGICGQKKNQLWEKAETIRESFSTSKGNTEPPGTHDASVRAFADVYFHVLTRTPSWMHTFPNIWEGFKQENLISLPDVDLNEDCLPIHSLRIKLPLFSATCWVGPSRLRSPLCGQHRSETSCATQRTTKELVFRLDVNFDGRKHHS